MARSFDWSETSHLSLLRLVIPVMLVIGFLTFVWAATSIWQEKFPEQAEQLSLLGYALGIWEVQQALKLEVHPCVVGMDFHGLRCNEDTIRQELIPWLNTVKGLRALEMASWIKTTFGELWENRTKPLLNQLLLLNLKEKISDEALLEWKGEHALLDILGGLTRMSQAMPECAQWQPIAMAIKSISLARINLEYYRAFADGRGWPVFIPGPNRTWNGAMVEERVFAQEWKVLSTMKVLQPDFQRQWLKLKMADLSEACNWARAVRVAGLLNHSAGYGLDQKDLIISIGQRDKRLKCPLAERLVIGQSLAKRSLVLKSALIEDLQLPLYRLLVSSTDSMPSDPALPLITALLGCTQQRLPNSDHLGKYRRLASLAKQVSSLPPFIIQKLYDQQKRDHRSISGQYGDFDEIVERALDDPTFSPTLPSFNELAAVELMDTAKTIKTNLMRVLKLAYLQSLMAIDFKENLRGAIKLYDDYDQDWSRLADWWFNQLTSDTRDAVVLFFTKHPLWDQVSLPLFTGQNGILVSGERELILRTILYLGGQLLRDSLLNEARIDFKWTAGFAQSWFGDAILHKLSAMAAEADGGYQIAADRLIIKTLIELRDHRPAFCPLSQMQIEELLELYLIHHAASYFALQVGQQVDDEHSAGFMKALFRLKSGPTTLFLPGSTGTHSFGLVVEKKPGEIFKVTLLNSGAGLEHHDYYLTADGGKPYHYFQSQDNLTIEDIASRGFYQSALRGVDAAGSFFLGSEHQARRLTSSKDTVSSQKSGTCWIKASLYGLKYLTRGETATTEATDESSFNWLKVWILHQHVDKVISILNEFDSDHTIKFDYYDLLNRNWKVEGENLPDSCLFGPTNGLQQAIIRHNVLKYRNLAKRYKGLSTEVDLRRMLGEIPKDPELLTCYEALK